MRYQGVCLESVSGCNTMDSYDCLPAEARLLLRNSTENLCPACLPRFLTNWTPVEFAFAISRMERVVRKRREASEPAF